LDRVNHGILMSRLAKRIGDRRILKLVRRYLESGVMAGGLATRRYKGTPQGGPVRYADDLRVFVRSKKAGERVMRSLVRSCEKLHRQVNASKSAVARVWHRPFLGFAFWVAPGKKVRMRVAPESLKAMKARVRQITGRNNGRSLAHVAEELRMYLLGWKGYFQLAATAGVFKSLDEWIRHRLRAMQLKQWKRGTTTYLELRKRGLSSDAAAVVAVGTRRWWHTSARLLNTAIPNTYFERLGVPRLASQ
jgi:RNA-directed DNA polymerase